MAGSMHGRGHVWQGVCIVEGGMHGGGCACQGAYITGGMHDMHPPRQILLLWHIVNEWAVGHPTGMHSCLIKFSPAGEQLGNNYYAWW